MEPPRGFTDSMVRLWEEFSRMPGIGRRSAERLTYYVLNGSREEVTRLARALTDIKDKVSLCSVCYNIAEHDPCKICTDAGRDGGIICVVEQPKDLLAIEGAGAYRGKYHVLHGRLSPLEGVEPESLTIEPLIQRLRKGGVREVVLATNPNVEGDATALHIAGRVGELNIKVTRLARGLPTGGSIDHASPNILSDAITGRRELPGEG